MTHEDFRYVPESGFSRPTSQAEKPPQVRGQDMGQKRSAQQEANEIARRAASICWRITNEHPDPKDWKAELEAAPSELRECLRAYLVQKFNELKDRRRREEAGKKCPAGDQVMAELRARYGQA